MPTMGSSSPRTCDDDMPALGDPTVAGRRPAREGISYPRQMHQLLVVLLGGAGALHLAQPETYDPIVPRALPGEARWYTYASGVAELGIAGTLACPRTRRAGGLAAAAFFVAVFPANVQMAWDWRRKRPKRRAIAYGRLPLQALLIAQALHVARRAAGDDAR